MSKTIQEENSAQARIRRNRDDMGKPEHSIDSGIGILCLAAGLLMILFVGGCRGSSEETKVRPIETVDVAPALEIGTEDDEAAVERGPSLVGLLPSDFPPDLPMYLPASLIDFGPAKAGWRYVSLLTPHSPARVERELEVLIRDQGWTGAGSAGVRTLRKGNRRARLQVADGKPGTVYRFEYVPQ